jgi:hypothetical protein
VQFILPMTASAFAAALDSLGGSDSNFDSQDDAAVAVSASTTLVTAAAAASALDQTVSASSGINIPADLDAFASTSSGPNASLSGSFQIVDGTDQANPVNVTIAALLSYSQSLATDANGLQANSEVIFQLSLPDVDANPYLFFDSPLQIGSSDTLSTSGSPTLSGDPASLALLTNTPYAFFLEADAESSGLNTSPEPSTFLLIAGALLPVVARRLKR